MKQKIEWHEACLAGMQSEIEGEAKKCKTLILSIEKLKVEIDMLKKQIDRAKAEGRLEFDSIKFGVRRKNKSI